jgi:hypothetical protein
MMRLTRWRAGTTITNPSKIVPPIEGATIELLILRHPFGQAIQCRRQIIEDPMDEGSAWGIRIFYYECKALSPLGRSTPGEWRREVIARASVAIRDACSV